MSDEEFLRLTTLYLEDAIDAGDLDLLNRELANSPDRVRKFNDMRLVTGLINEHGRAVESENAACATDDRDLASQGGRGGRGSCRAVAIRLSRSFALG